MDHPRHTFVRGDIADDVVAAPLVQRSHVVVHFAAETHVDRSIASASDFIKTDVIGTLRAARGRPQRAAPEPVRPDLDRRGLRQRAGGRQPRDRRNQAAQPVLGQQGRRRSPRVQLLCDLRRPGHHHPRVEQLRAIPVPREDHPAVCDQRDRPAAPAAVRRRPQRARLAARDGPLSRGRSAHRAWHQRRGLQHRRRQRNSQPSISPTAFSS